ncbi:MAG: TetR/AcrR family transcriptional regulator [Cocleimonas sp.]|nr:TetR/AcrR family transcriptional regulator [Cocleimonas sp.]
MMLSCTAEPASYEAFKKTFSCHGLKLYDYIFDNYPDVVQVKKRHVATGNLKKLFEAAFKISAKIGFHEMSLRDLCRETNISMGSVYTCISRKDNLAIIVKDVVSQMAAQNIAAGRREADPLSRLETTIRLHFYTSCVLQPWYSFLYMETRSLPEPHQTESKKIEASTVSNFESLIQSGVKEKLFVTPQAGFLAHSILALLQEWYLKPWKHKYQNRESEDYLNNILMMMRTMLGVRVV